MDYKRIQTTFHCNKTMEEVAGYYSMATKMYDLNMMDLGLYTTCRTNDNGDLLVVFTDELIAKFTELFSYDEVGLALIRPDNTHEVAITMENANVLVMHYVRTLCPDLRWIVKSSIETKPQFSNSRYET